MTTRAHEAMANACAYFVVGLLFVCMIGGGIAALWTDNAAWLLVTALAFCTEECLAGRI